MNRRVVLMVGFVVAVVMSLVVFIPGHTDPIVDSNGKVVEGSISEMKKIKIGGVNQWVVIRGRDRDKPILLMLSGGPGGSEMGRFMEFNKELENDFVMVNWEQRGCGKSYPAVKEKEDLTVEQYVSDVLEVTEYLKNKFNREKIYLLGHSWGTIIGTKAVQQKPENYFAYIGAAQMVNVKKTDKYMYNFVLEAARKLGDEKRVKYMEEVGEPPYYGKKMLKKYQPFLTNYAEYYKKLNPYVEKNPEWYSLSSMMFIPEYTFLDKVRVIKAMLNTFTIVYPQLQNMDFVTQANDLEVPVYYLIGRHDYTSKFIEEYFNILEAPKKELIYFENSGHGEVWSENEKFYNIMTEKVLKDTYIKM